MAFEVREKYIKFDYSQEMISAVNYSECAMGSDLGPNGTLANMPGVGPGRVSIPNFSTFIDKFKKDYCNSVDLTPRFKTRSSVALLASVRYNLG